MNKISFEKNYQIPSLKKTSERAELLKFFVENLTDPKGKKYRPAYLGMRLSHLKVEDLYYLISECKDRINRKENWQKYFWGVIKAK